MGACEFILHCCKKKIKKFTAKLCVFSFFFFGAMEGKVSLDWLVVCSLPSLEYTFYGGGLKYIPP